MSSFIITCPKCNHQFEPGESIREEIQNELRKQMVEWQKTKDQEYKNKEATLQKQLENREIEFNKILIEQKQKLQTELENSIQQRIAADFENKLQLLQKSEMETREKLRIANEKEIQFLQKEQALQQKETELELTIQRKLLDEREKIKHELLQVEQEKMNLKEEQYQLRMKELEKQIEDQKKLVDEMKRRAEQGSMQLQGEVQELLLEDVLRNTFPFDVISEVGKGVKGADCIQTVRNQMANTCGKIIYESKRTKDFNKEWIEKIKIDMRNLGADVAVIVTQAMPKEMDRFGEKEGIYICTFSEVRSVALLLRNALIKIAEAKKSQENKGEKMTMLYDYLTGAEFGEQWKAISEGFIQMKLSIQQERIAMEKLWKAREKQLEKVLLNAAHIKGSVEGIAGSGAVNLNLIDDESNLLLPD
ncbi:MAG: DUF2130 domain-containing protein [Hydrotalea flava]|uniref:DUF2130 domain-containing protein n=1 Tax=Hydrotalea sp. TaxID=2881279 RepID=UPI000B1F1633|nr:DUF2130 domain-containing protein [Hydrotalea sp.]NIM35891.1 DUF2130 domain-containing protein [Hydrotalea flava]NIM38743.1 DUF2130 domain-containing protein [Hydrotalea flava]NIN03931.1 DUF2130 domain-containing protein [Hydrotalea flava]NIN15652.1 DUF2130 domain-containing protein [Hydrotalea flava]NIO94669.1 DUF2130 domain-containing protein [Hydrotalea flava]